MMLEGFRSRWTSPRFSAAARRGSNLNRNLDHRAHVERTAPPDTILQGFALHQLHRVEALAGLLVDSELVGGGDIRMAQGRRRARFAQETFTHLGAARGKTRLDDFERDGALK